MTESQKIIYVYDDFDFNVPFPMGKLYVKRNQRRRNVFFRI